MDPAALDQAVASELSAGRCVAVLARRPSAGRSSQMTWIDAGTGLESYAHALYSNLRTLDKAGCDRLLVEAVPVDAAWDAVRDRLARAAARDDIPAFEMP